MFRTGFEQRARELFCHIAQLSYFCNSSRLSRKAGNILCNNSIYLK